MHKRILAVILAVCMLVTAMPMVSYAVGEDSGTGSAYLNYSGIDASVRGKNVSSDAHTLSSMADATISMMLKLSELGAQKKMLLSLYQSDRTYFEFYIEAGNITFRFVKDGSVTASGVFSAGELTAANWNAVTLTLDGQRAALFINSKKIGTASCTDTFSSLGGAETAYIGSGSAGQAPLKGNISNIKVYSGILSDSYILDTIGGNVIKSMLVTQDVNYNSGDNNMFIGSSIDGSFTEEMDQAVSFRIPSIVTVPSKDPNGSDVIVSSINKSNTGSDWGDLDVAVRRSYDGGKTWSSPIDTVFDLPTRKYSLNGSDYYSAFGIDPIMVTAANGDVLMFVDVFPESKGLHDTSMLDSESSAYVTVGGAKYLALYSENSKLNGGGNVSTSTAYTIREQGWVYDSKGNRTNYYVPQNHNAAYNLETTGDMYYCVGEPDYIDAAPPVDPGAPTGDEDVYVGNIYLSINKPSFSATSPQFVQKKFCARSAGYAYDTYETGAAPLRVAVCSYVWCFRSSDQGENWDHPLDITPMIRTSSAGSDNYFLGTGPGVGTVLKYQSDSSKNGRILLPLYTTGTTQGAACAYSDDNGLTWSRCSGSYTKNYDETQFVEFTNGTIMCLGRANVGWNSVASSQPVSYSYDGGDTWSSGGSTSMNAPKCQKGLIAYPMDSNDDKDYSSDPRFDYPSELNKGTQYVICSHPSKVNRYYGQISLGRVNSDNSVTWLYNRYYNGSGDFFAYSCLTILPNGNIGMVYEKAGGGNIQYAEFSLEWIMSKTGTETVEVPTSAPQFVGTSMGVEDKNNTPEKIDTNDVLNFTMSFDKSVFVPNSGSTVSFTIDGAQRTAQFSHIDGREAVYTYQVTASDRIDDTTQMAVSPVVSGDIEGVLGGKLLYASTTPIPVTVSTKTQLDISDITYVQGADFNSRGTNIADGSYITFKSLGSIVGTPECITPGANVTLTKTAVDGSIAYALSGTANPGNLGFKVTYRIGDAVYTKILYTYVRYNEFNAHALSAFSKSTVISKNADNQTVHTLLNSEGYSGNGYISYANGSYAFSSDRDNFAGTSASGQGATAVVRASVIVDKSVTEKLSDVLKIRSSLARSVDLTNYSSAIQMGAYKGNTASSSMPGTTSYTTPKGNVFSSDGLTANLGTSKGGSSDNAVRSISGPLVSDQFRIFVDTNSGSYTMYYNYQQFDIDLYVVDKGLLRTEVNKAFSGFPQEKDYTPESYGAFLAAYARACEALNNDAVSAQAEIDAAAEGLTVAVNGLEKVNANADYLVLDEAIARYEGLNLSQFVDTQAAAEAYRAATAIDRQLPASEQAAVDAAASALNSAIDALVYKGADYSEYHLAVVQATSLNESDYVDFTAVKEALGVDVSGLNITQQAKVDAQTAAIREAVSKLVYKRADYTAYNDAVKLAGTLNGANYSNFDIVLKALAVDVIGLDITKQGVVDAQTAAILEAIDKLEYKGANYTAYHEAVARASVLIESNYVDFSAVKAALAVDVSGLNITQQETVDAQTAAIYGAMEKLVYRGADYSAYTDAVNQANRLNRSDYVDFAAVDAALAVDVSGLDITNQATVDAQTAAILKAIDSLVPLQKVTLTVLVQGAGSVLLNGETVAGGNASEFAKGVTVELRAVGNEGARFCCWMTADGNVLSTQADYQMTLSDSVSVTAVFESVYTVTFYGMNGEVLSVQRVVEGEDAVAPAAPAYNGYQFMGWTGYFTNVVCDESIYSMYEAVLPEYSVNAAQGVVLAGRKNESGKYDDNTRVTAYLEDYSNFKGWSLDGGKTIVSYDQVYTFYIRSDVELVYVEKHGGSVSITDIEMSEGIITVFAERTAPDYAEYTLVRSGVLYTQDKTAELTLESASGAVNVFDRSVSGSEGSAVYSAVIKPEENGDVFVRAYAVYQNAKGETLVVYSIVQTGVFSGGSIDDDFTDL